MRDLARGVEKRAFGCSLVNNFIYSGGADYLAAAGQRGVEIDGHLTVEHLGPVNTNGWILEPETWIPKY
jgi:hypothetical protein